ncbi:MAG: Eco57I restriction-modification methylase domain-containing protein [Treponema sp.]|jgi:hypothetical protein|nr:Eco57I restriction-modification methylase domain-containing protein [Treponema sp.]
MPAISRCSGGPHGAFSEELLYLLGLREEHGRAVRTGQSGRRNGMLIENVMTHLAGKIPDASDPFSIALELCLTWINRILVLKMIEARQLRYCNGGRAFSFLNSERIHNYQELDTLFFSTLNVQEPDRPPAIANLTKNVPFLRCPLFDMTETEKRCFSIGALENAALALFPKTVLKDRQGKKRGGEMDALEYLFAFLDAFDFSGVPDAHGSKPLIKPAVIGLIFEKINGCRDGAYFTPDFITSYMCRETLRRAVTQKFNAAKGWHCASFAELKRAVESIAPAEANGILRAFSVCDPAAGAGHFLVSALNEIIVIKSELRLLCGEDGERLHGYTARIENDELCMAGEDGTVFAYRCGDTESQRVQETLFREKRIIIENALFGMDINENAVNICRLRLWLELLKSAYYSAEPRCMRLSPLPEIGFHVISGNSLLDLPDAFPGSGFDAVVGNPPYLGERGHRALFAPVKSGALGRFYQGKMDYFYFFFHLALEMLNDNGVGAFITTNYYITAYGAAKLRRDFEERAILLRLVNFNELRIFPSAPGQHNMITMFRKGHDAAALCACCLTARSGYADAAIVQRVVSGADFLTAYEDIPQADLYDGAERYLRMTKRSRANPFETIFAKIGEGAFLLGDICHVNQGLVSGADTFSESHHARYPRIDARVGEGIFILDADRDGALLEQIRAENPGILKPLYKNSDAARYAARTETRLFLLYADKKNPDGINVPSIRNHLKKYQAVIEHSSVNAPFLHRPRDEAIFLSPKIVVPQRSLRNTFAYNETPWYGCADLYFITIKDTDFQLKYILGLLNSTLYYQWFYHRGKRKGDMIEFYSKPLAETPIPRAPPEAQCAIVRRVDAILAAKAADLRARTSALEAAIDREVCALCGLTDTERAAVDGAA